MYMRFACHLESCVSKKGTISLLVTVKIRI
jgi:hypothetical protein